MARVIAITGAAGSLGVELAPILADDGWHVRMLDVSRPGNQAGEFIQTDIRRVADVRRALDGAEAVVHAAAWHGVHLRDHTPRDFWELNVDGTYNVLEAAAHAGVGRIVLSSTMGVYGDSAQPNPDGPAVRVQEALPLLPGDIYGQSKVLAERLVAFFERAHGMRGVALRYGMFVPEPFAHYGIRMLYGGVDVRDVAAANVAALRKLEDPGRFTAYNIFSSLPFGDDDLEDLRRHPMDAIKRHWPDADPLLESVAARPWGPINTVYDIGRAARDLGWHPRFGFGEFLEGLRGGARDVSDLVPSASSGSGRP